MNEIIIEVLLSTYNGEAFLQEQIDSILGQTGVTVKILARDDGSTDDTVEILSRFSKKEPDRFNLLAGPEGNIGVVKSFELLLSKSKAPYVAFADQDDIWVQNKLSKSAEALLEIEKSGRKPALVYTDLRVVSENMKILHESFFSYMRLNPERGKSTRMLCLQNCVVGCTALLNRELVNIVLPFPDSVIMHDWWTGLCAAYSGKAVYLPNQTVEYRQHLGNVVGAKSVFSRALSIWARRNDTTKAISQAVALLDVSRSCVSDKDEYFLKSLSKATNSVSVKYQLLKHGAIKDGILRNLYFFLLAK